MRGRSWRFWLVPILAGMVCGVLAEVLMEAAGLSWWGGEALAFVLGLAVLLVVGLVAAWRQRRKV